jgi:hypothetical protein
LTPSREFLPGETLVFFDELQEFPEIATAMNPSARIDGMT